MKEDSGLDVATLRVDGGASRSDLMLQFQADLLQVEVQRPEYVETTALGAAYLAGLAVGVWKDRSEIAESWKMQQSFQPQMDAATADNLKQQWNRAVDRSKSWEVAE